VSASGRDIKNRPQLERAVDALGKGDILVLPEWDRATRSMLDGVHIIERIHARGALLKVLDKPHLDSSALLSRWFTSRIGSIMSLPYAAIGVGMLTVPPLTQLLLHAYDWRITHKTWAPACSCCFRWSCCCRLRA
jgi:Resolvase, N terminal domain